MFTNKEEFIKQYEERFIQTYGRSYKYADDSEMFLTLGEYQGSYFSEWPKAAFLFFNGISDWPFTD